MYKLGDLSSQYESNGDPGVISHCAEDAGGTSYGAWQFANNFGIPQAFVDWLVDEGSHWGARLNQYCPDTPEFDAEWTAIAQEDRGGFLGTQHEYVRLNYYVPAVAEAAKAYIDLEKRSFALRNVVWSASVQYGPGNIKELFDDAAGVLGYPNASYAADKELIEAIYTVRTSDEWTGGSPTLRYGLRRRFSAECGDALELLAFEGD